MKKWWVKLLLACALLLLAVSAWFIGAGAQSHDALEGYRKQLLAAGEKLDLKAFVPVRADPSRNSAALLDQAYDFLAPRGLSPTSSNPPAAMEMVAPGHARILWQQNEIVSVLNGRHATNTWTDIEWDLASQRSALDFFQQAAASPEFDFGIDYRYPYVSLPHLSKLGQATGFLEAKVVFDLHSGDTASAVTNLHVFLVVANADKNEPLIGPQANRSIFMQKALATQWELLQATNVTDEQLAKLQTNWMEVDFVQSTEKIFEMARCVLGDNMKETRANPSTSRSMGGTRVSVGGGWDDFRRFIQLAKLKVGTAFWRESWCFDDELKLMQAYSVMVETVRQGRTNGYFKDAFTERERKITALGLNRTNVNSLRTFLGGPYLEYDVVRAIRSYASIVDRMLAMEAWRECAITAIALKRYELRHGMLPKDLAALVPEFLPAVFRDPVDGHPLRYRLNADGTFVLYSIGVDGIDNGGDATPVPPATTLQWQTGRDWVWPQPATLAEVQNYYAHPPK